MLYRLEIENFHSVRDRQVLDLSIAANVTDPGGRFAPLFPGSDVRAPKVIALYGANASGKTTVLKALQFLVGFTRDSVGRTVPGFPCEPFNDEESASSPVKLAIEFGGVMDLDPKRMSDVQSGVAVQYGLYRYELVLDSRDGVVQRVHSETLRQKPGAKGKWQRVFERDIAGEIKGCASFPISGFQHLRNTLRSNASVISSFALFQHPTASIFFDFLKAVFGNMYSEGGSANDQALANLFAHSPELVDVLNEDLRRIDIGVGQMHIENTANGPLLLFRHDGLRHDVTWPSESNGTRAFIRLFPLLTFALQRGGIAIVDEFDILIHPLILPEILRWFYDGATRNPHDAQIWLSCHSASLLDDLEKEEVAFCEKDGKGRTSVYSLMDVKAVRRDDNLYGKYLSGVYGAVPQIG